MRILYIHQHFCTPAGSGGTRSYEFARRWVRQGHEVQILCGTGYDPTLSENKEFEVDGIYVRTLAVRYDSRMSFPRRILSFLLFAFKSMWIAARAQKFDIVFATSTPLTVALPALAAHWIAGRPMVFEVRDVWPDAAVDAGALRNPLLIAGARMLEAIVYRSAIHIVALSTGMKNRIRSKGVPSNKLSVIPNCSDIDKFSPSIDGSIIRCKYDAQDKFIALYIGALNQANYIEFLVDVATELHGDQDIEIWFVGGGPRVDYLQSERQKRRLENIRCFGLQPKEKIPAFASAADVGLVTFILKPVYYENSPNKFFDYIAAGLPVIFNRSTWLQPWLEQYQIGWSCQMGRKDEMVTMIRMLRDNPKQCRQMGRNARHLAESVFSRDVMSQKLLSVLESCLG